MKKSIFVVDNLTEKEVELSLDTDRIKEDLPDIIISKYFREMQDEVVYNKLRRLVVCMLEDINIFDNLVDKTYNEEITAFYTMEYNEKRI